MEYKHVCDQCGEKFKNSILLKRHVCQKKDTKSKCNVCSKCFSDVSLFNIHNKTHVKTTTSVTISPEKFLRGPSTSGLQKPRITYKCERCSKICPTQALLTKHEKCHISFACPICRAKFASEILRDSHLRLTSGKQKFPKNKRISFKIRKSFVQSPRIVSEKRKKKVNPGLNSESMSRQDHGLETSDKRVLVHKKKTIHKPLNVHGGIPASSRCNKAFQCLREKFANWSENGTIFGGKPEDK